MYTNEFFESYTLKEELFLYKEMKENDPIINTSVEVLKTPLISSRWDIEIEKNTDKHIKARELLYKVFDNINLNRLKTNFFTMIDYGFSMAEKTFIRTDEGYVLDNIEPLDITLLKDYSFDNDEFYLVLEGYDKNRIKKTIKIGLDDLFFGSYNPEFNNVIGKPILKPLRVVYQLKKAVLQADARLRIRGAGIVVGGLSSELFVNNEIRNSFENMLANIGNNKNGYGVYVLDKSKIDFIAPIQNNNNLDLLRYLDHCIFYNTQTQFLFAGIDNQNGGRANTREHRLVYVNKINGLLDYFEKQMNKLIQDMLSLTVYDDIKEDIYFHVFRITEYESTEVADQIAKLGRLIQLRPQDEVWFRNAFGLPEVDLDQISNNKILQDTNTGELREKQVVNNKIELQYANNKMSKKAFEILELTRIRNNINIFENISERILTSKYIDILKSLGEKLQKRTNINLEDIKITDKDKNDLIRQLYEVYNRSYQEGKEIMIKEINKVLKEKGSEKIEMEFVMQDVKTKDILGLIVERFLDANVSSIQYDLANKTIEAIQSEGYVDYTEYLLDKYKDNNKSLMNDIKSMIANGVIDGRGEIIEKYADEVRYYEYSAVLDENVCKKCHPFDGQQKTLEEWQQLGINLFSPVNPNCEGGNKCRCVLIPIY